MTNKTKLNRAARRLQERKARRAVAGGHQSAPSPQRRHAPSSSRQSLEGDLSLLERYDGHAFLRNRLREIAQERGDWAGIPMPMSDMRLVVEPRYPNAQALMAMGPQPEVEEAGVRQINTWYSPTRRCDILLYRHDDGRVEWGVRPAVHSLNMALNTLGGSDAWGLEQEARALQLLADLLPHRKFKQYLLTGSFLETSKRSRVTYLFRKLRPTVAIDASGATCRIMCALCMHPIAHYAGSWAGAMTPTDDVIAHLTLMRGDEAMFWRRSTQHPAIRPEAGL